MREGIDVADNRVVAELVAQGAQKFIQDFANATRSVSDLTNQLQAASRVRTPQLAPSIEATNVALQRSRQSAVDFVRQLHDLTNASSAVTTASNRKTRAIKEQGDTEQAASRQGITYLSTLSAIHAASFLATNRTFSLVGSFFTLGAAFSRLGPGAVALGLAFGGLLGVFNAVNTVTSLYQQAIMATAQVTVVAAGIIAAAVTATGVAGVKLAADVEQGLALIQAIEGASREQLGRLTGEAQRLALAFGISVKDIVDASSLFTRAGGNIEEAINGATDAIIQLQVASAGELKAAEAARAIAVGLQAFSAEGRTAIDIANALTAVAQRSALSFTEVAQAFQQAVPGSVTLGISLSDLSAIIVTLGNNALRGTVAGTSFKQFLLDLVNPSEKSAKKLVELGISIKDVDGNIRPIISIIGDLNTALDSLTPAGRAEAIAEIFESRAGLAGAILSRQTVEQLQELRAELDSLTATNVVNVLLLPLNAQLQRLQVTIGELGRVFGGTLLQPIRTATVAAVEFFQRLIPLAQLAGQAVQVIATNQGFGALQQKISEIANDQRLSVFLVELVNTFRNVRSAIMDQIVPALGEFVQTIGLVLSETGRLTDTVTTFRNINVAIQTIAAVIARAIREFTLLAVAIIHNEGRGKELRDTLQTIATAILSRVVASLVTMAAFIAATTVVMIHLADVSLQAVGKMGNAFEKLAAVHEALANSFIDVSLRAQQFAAAINLGNAALSGNIDEMEDAKKRLDAITILLNAPRVIRNPFAQTFRDLANATSGAKQFAEELTKSLSPEGIKDQTDKVLKSFEQLSGELPTFLSNLLDEVERTMAQVRADVDQGPAALNIVDTKEITRVTQQIEEAGRDLSRRLDNIAEDTTTKIGNIVARALERIGDINDKLQTSLAKLDRETTEKIDDLNQAVVQRRDDRSRLDVEKRQQERRLQVIERSLEKQQLFEERQLEQTRIARQRGLEDVQRVYDLQADAAERSYSRAQEAAEASFSAQQDAQQKALELTQSAEEKALQRQLDLESRTRDEGQQRSEAKTPEDRKRVEEQIAKARQGRNFEQRQQGQLDALATRHEAQRTQLAARQEQQQLAFKTQQEDAALVERLKRDARALVFRRELENQERNVRLREEDTALERRINNETVLDTIKRTQAKAFQDFQDGLENEANKRRIEEFKADELKRKAELTQGADTQRGEVLDGVTQQLSEVNQAVEREVRNALDRLKDIEDSLTPDVAAAVRGALLGVQQAALSRAKTLIEGTQVQTQQAQAVVGAQVAVTQPTQVATLVATTMQVATLNLPGGFVNGIAQGMFFALAEADRRGFFDSDVPSLQGLIDELRAPSPLPTRR